MAPSDDCTEYVMMLKAIVRPKNGAFSHTNDAIDLAFAFTASAALDRPFARRLPRSRFEPATLAEARRGNANRSRGQTSMSRSTNGPFTSMAFAMSPSANDASATAYHRTEPAST